MFSKRLRNIALDEKEIKTNWEEHLFYVVTHLTLCDQKPTWSECETRLRIAAEHELGRDLKYIYFIDCLDENSEINEQKHSAKLYEFQKKIRLMLKSLVIDPDESYETWINKVKSNVLNALNEYYIEVDYMERLEQWQKIREGLKINPDDSIEKIYDQLLKTGSEYESFISKTKPVQRKIPLLLFDGLSWFEKVPFTLDLEELCYSSFRGFLLFSGNAWKTLFKCKNCHLPVLPRSNTRITREYCYNDDKCKTQYNNKKMKEQRIRAKQKKKNQKKSKKILHDKI